MLETTTRRRRILIMIKGEVRFYDRQGNVLYLDSIVDLHGDMSLKEICEMMIAKGEVDDDVYVDLKWHGFDEMSKVKKVSEIFRR
jgi:hypothetical protein